MTLDNFVEFAHNDGEDLERLNKFKASIENTNPELSSDDKEDFEWYDLFDVYSNGLDESEGETLLESSNIVDTEEEYIDCLGMGILTVMNKLKDYASRGNAGELTVQSSDGGCWHSYFTPEDWTRFKDGVNEHAAITKVWIKEVPGDSYTRILEAKRKRHPNIDLFTCDCGTRTSYTFGQRAKRDGYSDEDAQSMADFADLDLNNDLCQKCYAQIRDDWCQYNGKDKLKESEESNAELKEFLKKEAAESNLFDEIDIQNFEANASESDWNCLKDLKAKTENPEYADPACLEEIDQAVADIVLYEFEKEHSISEYNDLGIDIRTGEEFPEPDYSDDKFFDPFRESASSDEAYDQACNFLFKKKLTKDLDKEWLKTIQDKVSEIGDHNDLTPSKAYFLKFAKKIEEKGFEAEAKKLRGFVAKI